MQSQYLESLLAPKRPLTPHIPPDSPWHPKCPPTPPRSPPIPPDAPIPLLVPDYLEFLLAPNTPLTLLHPWCPQTALHPLGALNAPWCPYTPAGSWVARLLVAPTYTPVTPQPLTPPMPPNGPYTPRSPPMPLISPIPLLVPEYWGSLPAFHMPLTSCTHHDNPLTPLNRLPIPLHPSGAPWCPLYSFLSLST